MPLNWSFEASWSVAHPTPEQISQLFGVPFSTALAYAEMQACLGDEMRRRHTTPIENTEGYIDGSPWRILSTNVFSPDTSQPYPWDAIAQETAEIEAAKPPLLDRINALIGE